MKDKIAAAFFVGGAEGIVPGCMQIWEGVEFPERAATAGLLVLIGLAVQKIK